MDDIERREVKAAPQKDPERCRRNLEKAIAEANLATKKILEKL